MKIHPNIFKRILAGLFDYTAVFAFTFFIAYAIGEPNGEGGYSLKGFSALIPIIFWMLMTVGLEMWLGATIGNAMVGLKPIPLNEIERKLTFEESFKRHLLDPIDMSLFGLVGIITIKNTEKHQRVGDLWAKTVVISLKSPNKLKT